MEDIIDEREAVRVISDYQHSLSEKPCLGESEASILHGRLNGSRDHIHKRRKEQFALLKEVVEQPHISRVGFEVKNWREPVVGGGGVGSLSDRVDVREGQEQSQPPEFRSLNQDCGRRPRAWLRPRMIDKQSLEGLRRGRLSLRIQNGSTH